MFGRSVSTLAVVLFIVAGLAAAQDPGGDPHADAAAEPQPPGSTDDPNAERIEKKFSDKPDSVIHREIARARADQAQWDGVAVAPAATSLGALSVDADSGAVTGRFVAVDVDAPHGTWRNLSVATADGSRVTWLAAVDPRPFTHGHGPVVTGPTLRLFCKEMAFTLTDAPSGVFTLRTQVEVQLGLTIPSDIAATRDGPRGYVLASGAEHAHLFFTRGTTALDNSTLVITLPPGESVTFRVHAGPGIGDVHAANEALAKRVLKLEVFGDTAASGHDFEHAWGAGAVLKSLDATGGEWRVQADDEAAFGARFVIAGWSGTDATVSVDSAAVTFPSGDPEPGFLRIEDGALDAWLKLGPGEHTVSIQTVTTKKTPGLGALALLAVGAAALVASVTAKRGGAGRQ